jgi:hypothetical protein
MQSDAYRNFQSSLAELKSLLQLLMPTRLNQSFKLFERRVGRIGKNSKIDLGKALSDFKTDFDNYVQGRETLQNWLSVMLVTITESYLEEGLVALAAQDATLTIDIQLVSPKTILAAKSLDELQKDIRQQWAARFLNGGPRQWLPALRKLGAINYEKECGFRLQHLWDTRNLVVHTRGILRPDYVQRYPNPPLKAGENVKVSLSLFGWWLDGLGNFVKVTDEMFVKRGAKASSGLPSPKSQEGVAP